MAIPTAIVGPKRAAEGITQTATPTETDPAVSLTEIETAASLTGPDQAASPAEPERAASPSGTEPPANLTESESTGTATEAESPSASSGRGTRPRPSLQGRGGRGESRPDRAARFTATGAGGVIVVTLAAVAIFLLLQGWPALWAGEGDLPSHATNFWELAGPLAFGSVWASALALLIAAPIAVAAALFITQYAPRRWLGLLGTAIDLLAAVPSVVYGLWGLMVFAPIMAKVFAWLSAHAGWIPLFSGQPSATGRTVLTAACVLAIMILPIMASVCREVFAQTPVLSKEAALALGASRWEMIRMAVFPYARSGIISSAMLGLGRALGETMAIAMVLSPTPFLITFRLLESTNPNTVAALIAQTFPEAHGMEVRALIALGLILFVVTCAVNSLARRIAARGVVKE